MDHMPTTGATTAELRAEVTDHIEKLQDALSTAQVVATRLEYIVREWNAGRQPVSFNVWADTIYVGLGRLSQ